MRHVCYQRNDVGTDTVTTIVISNAVGPNGEIVVIWEGASISRVTVTSILGEVLASVVVAPDARQTKVNVPTLAHQPVFVMVHNYQGEILYRETYVP